MTERPEVGDELLQRVEDGVLWLTLNRADRGNAIPWYVRDALIEAFDRAHSDLAVRCVVLAAAGERHFCTGADLTVPQPARFDRPDGAPERPVGAAVDMMRRGFQVLMQKIQDCEKPVIAAVNGTAAGGGAMLVLAADLVVAADHARIIQVFVRRGLVPDGGTAYLLPRIVGLHKAKELVFFGDDLRAADAERLGIVNRVVPGDQLEAVTREWAARLAAGPTKAIGWAKKLLHDASELSRRDLLIEEAMLVELNAGTVDSAEGVAAFRERREPEWKGW
jgi:2-(1,2-epoxy-1,2-dihydrophenyl)acetyl-CoA isomerase